MYHLICDADTDGSFADDSLCVGTPVSVSLSLAWFPDDSASCLIQA